MAINPPSDIVLDVIRAADPKSAGAATEKLAKLAGATAPADVTFDQALGRASVPAAPRMPFDPTSAVTAMRTGRAMAPERAGPLVAFEAFVLQSFVETMLPSGDGAIFGKGTAGAMWRSMLAEGLAGELARSGGIGIADALDGRNTEAMPDVGA